MRKVFRNKLSLMSISLVLVLLLAACGGSNSTSSNTSSNSNNSSNSSNSSSNASSNESNEVETHLMEVGISPAEDSVQNRAVIEMGKRINERTNGMLELHTFPGGQLGSGEQMLEATTQGSLHAVPNSTAFLSSIAPVYGIFDLPYLFPDMDAVMDFIKTDHAKYLLEQVEGAGLKALAFWPNDFKKMTANVPITSLEDLDGLKFRTLPSEILISQYKDWGANAISLPLPELYNALTQGTVDSQENTMGVIYDFKLFEATKYIMMSDHSLTTNMFLVNKDWFESLPQELQVAMQEEALAIGELMYQWEMERFQGLVDEINATGKNEFVEVSDDEKQRLREAAQPTYDNFIKKFPEAEEIIQYIEENY